MTTNGSRSSTFLPLLAVVLAYQSLAQAGTIVTREGRNIRISGEYQVKEKLVLFHLGNRTLVSMDCGEVDLARTAEANELLGAAGARRVGAELCPTEREAARPDRDSKGQPTRVPETVDSLEPPKTRSQPELQPAREAAHARSPASSQSRDAQPQPPPPVPTIWNDPGVVEELDLAGGPGGREKAPKPPFTFLAEADSGSTPRITVEDANGTTWHVKWGSEVNSDIFASRLAWAAGYSVDSGYFVANGRIEGVGGLTRAREYVNSDGSFEDARFERHIHTTVLGGKKSWRWDENPLVGTAELNGLKIVMMLTSNWDNKDQRDASRGSNTAILEYRLGDRTEHRYVVTDWGGSMGKWGGFLTREKWDVGGYEEQTPDFIEGVEDGFVEWGYSGQHTGSFNEDISVMDVKWLLRYIGRISDRQIRDGLRASGATPDEVERFTRAIRNRIDQMHRL
jgi:hypothetical protein